MALLALLNKMFSQKTANNQADDIQSLTPMAGNIKHEPFPTTHRCSNNRMLNTNISEKSTNKEINQCSKDVAQTQQYRPMSDPE